MKKTQMDLNPEDPENQNSAKDTTPAKEAKNTEKKAGPAEEAAKEQPPQKAGKKRLLLLGGIGLLVLLGGVTGIGAYLGWIKIPGMSSHKASAPPPIKKVDIGPMVKMAPLIINLNDEGGRHYVKATLVLELAQSEAAEEVKSKLPSLIDMTILMLGDKKLEDLRNPDAKENLKKEFLAKSNRVVSEGKIKGIYLDEFLLQ